MGGEPAPPPPPGGEPTSKKPADPPAVDEGSTWTTVADWYERHKNRNSIFQSDYWKTVVGLSVTFVGSLATKITIGWQHKTVAGWSRHLVYRFENKINIAAVLNYIRPIKEETTFGNKTEWILGVKISHVRGKKFKFEGSNKTEVSDLELAEKTHKLNQHTAAVEKALATAIKTEIGDLEKEHNLVQAQVKTWLQEYDTLDSTISSWKEKADKLTAEVGQFREECNTVADKYSGTFKSLASAAHTINTSASLEKTLNGEAKFIAGSLMQLGAAITKAG